MGSFPKATHKYAFAMVEAARTMPADKAEKLDHIKQLRFDVQLKALRKRIKGYFPWLMNLDKMNLWMNLYF